MNMMSVWQNPEGEGIPPPATERLEDIGKIRNAIIQNLKGLYVFEKGKKQGIDPLLETGFLQRSFRLSELRICCGYEKSETCMDNEIIDVLETLCKSGKLNVFEIQLPDQYDVHFATEVGRANKSFHGSMPAINFIEFFVDAPLKTVVGCLNISEDIKKLRSDLEKKLIKKYGVPETMERILHHEKVMDDIEFKKRLLGEI